MYEPKSIKSYSTPISTIYILVNLDFVKSSKIQHSKIQSWLPNGPTLIDHCDGLKPERQSKHGLMSFSSSPFLCYRRMSLRSIGLGIDMNPMAMALDNNQQ